MKGLLTSVFLGLSLLSQSALAVDAEVKQRILDALEKIIPATEITSVSESDIAGLYQVMMGTDIVYVTEDGRYAITGEMYDINKRENLTDSNKTTVRKEILGKIPASEIIEFKSEKPEHIIYVFTDITCGYCRKLHQEVPVLNENGVSVRYLAFPRGGPTSGGADQLISVWCSNNQNKAMTEAKLGKETKSETCDNPVAGHYKLGAELGVRGTPAIFFADGRSMPGYNPPEIIINALKQ